MITERKVSASGGIVIWSAGTDFDRARLDRNLDLAGFKGIAPSVRTNESSLEQALISTLKDFKAEYVVKALKKRAEGFDVSEMDRGHDQVTYRSIFKASVNDQHDVTIIRNGSSMIDTWQFQNSVQRAYDTNKRQTTGAAVGKALITIVEKLDGIRMRDSGGVYWVPEDRLSTWMAVEGAVTDAAVDKTKIKFDLLRTMADERGLRAIKSSLEDEVTRVASELLTEITSGELKEVALENRRAAAVALEEKVTAYEQIIGETLENLRSTCAICKEAAVNGALALMNV